MNDIDKLPSKCRDCAYWELAKYPWYCRDCTEKMNPKNSEYIKRIDAKKALTALPADLDAETIQRCIEAMNNPKAADVEPKRSTGWWIPGDYVAVEHGECVTYPGEGITCSWCHYGFKGKFLWSRDYCPHCGSRMHPEPPKEEA